LLPALFPQTHTLNNVQAPVDELVIAHAALHIINCDTDQSYIACGVRPVRVDPVNADVCADIIAFEGECFAGNRAASILFLEKIEQVIKRKAIS
jgi:hypothetical protein